MAIGRITGQMLSANLARSGTDLAFETNLLVLDVTNSRVGVGTASPATTLHVSATDALRLPSGSTAQRPGAPANGDIRYNSDTGAVEGYAGGWLKMTGGTTLADADDDTGIEVERSADEDAIHISTGGTDRAHIRSNGNIELNNLQIADMTVSTLTTNGDLTLTPNGSGKVIVTDGTTLQTNTADINGGAIDGAVIGANDAAAGTFTTINTSGNATVGGNLTVNGTTTTISTTNTTVADNIFELNSGTSSNANDSGLLIERGSTGDNAFIGWDESEDKFTMGTTTATAGDKSGGISVTTGTLVANVEGNVTGDITTNVITSSDSTAVRINDALNVDGALDVGAGLTLSNGTSVTAINDEDNMSSNSATALATQQSIKAYVDAEDANIASDTLTLTNKTFDANGTGNSISNIDFADFASGVVLDEDNMSSNSATNLATQQSIKAYVDTEVGNVSTTSISQGNSSATISDTGSDGALTVVCDGNTELVVNDTSSTFSGNVIVSGNLTVSGTTTTVNSTNTTIADNLIELQSGISASSNDSGIIIERGSTGNNAAIIWDESEDKFAMGTTTATASDKSGGISVSTATLVANIEGTVNGNITGNVTAGNIQVGVTGNNEIDTSSGNLTIDSAGGTVTVDDNLTVNGTTTAGTLVTNVISSSDSTAVRLNDALNVDGALDVGAGLTLSNGTSVTAINDEDNMSSNSATALATQQSIKAYVDAEDANIASDTLTFTNKTFDANGTGNSISNIDFADFTSGVVADEDDMSSDSATKLATQQSIKAYVDTEVGNVSTTSISQGNSSATISDTGSDGALTVVCDGNTELVINDTSSTFSGNVVINGNMTVNGTSTTIDSTTLTVEDPLIQLAKNNSGGAANSFDQGLFFNRGSLDNVSFIWDETEDEFAFAVTSGEDGTTAGNITIDSYANIKAGVAQVTDIETGSISAADGTESATIANSTGVMTIASSVLTTADINGGTADDVTIGGATPAAGTFTTATATSVNATNVRANDGTAAIVITDSTGAVAVSTALTATGAVSVDGGNFTFNESSASVDARFESNGDTHALFIDGSEDHVGIRTSSPAYDLDVSGSTDAVRLPVGSTAQRPTAATGIIRYNSTTAKYEGCTDGSTFVEFAIAGDTPTFTKESTTGDGSTTTFTGFFSSAPESANNVFVYIDNVYQEPTENYTVSGTNITFTSAPHSAARIFAITGADNTALVTGGIARTETSSVNFTSTATTIMSFNAATYRSAELFIQLTDTANTEYAVMKANVVHDGSTAYGNVYGVVNSGSTDLATITFEHDGSSTVNVKATTTGGQTAAKVQYSLAAA